VTAEEALGLEPPAPAGALPDDLVRSLVANLDVAIILREVDPPRFVYVSPAFERIFGWPVERLLADPWFLREHSHPADRETVTARMADFSVTPLPDIEWRIIRPDGEVRWIRAKRSFLDAAPGRPQQVAGFIEDITDRKTTELELERSKEWFEAIAETVPIGFAIRDADTQQFQYVSAAFEEIFGRPRSDFYADPVAGHDMAHPDAEPTDIVMAEPGTPWSYEGRIVRPDGDVRWVRGHQVVTRGRGTGSWLASTVEDVTERRVKEERLRTLVEADIVGVLVADRDRIIDANDRFLHILGYTREDLEAGLIRPDQLTPPEWLTVNNRAMEELAATGSCQAFEKEYFTKHGDRVPVLVGSAILDPDRNRFSTIVLDLTEVKQVEVALRRAEADALRANEAKNAFLSRMSHELRTPLNAVIGFGQLLALDDLTADQREGVEQIVKGGNHLLALINEVLDISRIESGGLRLSLEPVQLAEVVDESLALVGHLGDLRHVSIEDHCPPSCSAYVKADRQRLRQVVLNLLANAIKYNRDHGKVSVRCQRVSDQRIRLVVSDTGIGISLEGMSRLFSPFDRLGAEHTDVEGTGLGLALTQRLVEAMDGEIGAESVAGEGSTFWVELDIATADQDLDHPVLVPVPAEPVVAPPQATVLYIEDNQANVRLVQRILALREGVGAMVAMQASLGLDLARTHVPDLILLDLNLPDMSGTEALRRLRADPVTADIPVVVISADATAGQISRLRAEGAVDYLAKPFDIERLLELVDEHAIGHG
jgi:PAS domain S-box-containing protein